MWCSVQAGGGAAAKQPDDAWLQPDAAAVPAWPVTALTFAVPQQVSGQYLAKNGISTFACSETQKFGHVTFFWNGNRSGYFDESLETFVEVWFLSWGSLILCSASPPCFPPTRVRSSRERF